MHLGVHRVASGGKFGKSKEMNEKSLKIIKKQLISLKSKNAGKSKKIIGNARVMMEKLRNSIKN